VSRRSDVLELAVLGLLHDGPLHGYELRKRLAAVLGPMRALSYGTLYPALKAMVAAGLLREAPADGVAAPLAGKRARISYELTADGKERFQTLVRSPGPSAWEDENFGVHFAFFARTDAVSRMEILEGRRTRLQERLELLRQSMSRTARRFDRYTQELQRHGEESVEREVRWLSELIDTERASNMTHLQDPDKHDPKHDPDKGDGGTPDGAGRRRG